MPHDDLKQHVWEINLGIVEAGLVLLTWGNASGVDRAAGVVAIKPSGVDYEKLHADDMVILSLKSGEQVEGELKPSSDTATHLELYRAFDGIGAIVHTHSTFATSWAQAGREIPCMGTTHADHFYGPVPIARALSADEIANDYESNTGRAIVERFVTGGIDPLQVPGVLLPGHGPFAWGATPAKAMENAIVLEEVAKLNTYALMANPEAAPIPQPLLDKHFLRKHGKNAYYGQK
jgi:L-ribulose-5-phosphate 4-epimerase